MSLTRFIRAALMALFGFLVILPSWAEDLPTSVNPATGKWEHMRPTSFSPTLVSAIEQCNRTAEADAGDRLTLAMCVKFEELLRSGQCRKALVRDGVVFDHMNGRHSGRSRLTHNVEKALGRLDPALICDLGEHVHAYWFVGKKGESCNNVGIVFEAIPPAPVAGVCGSNARTYKHDETSWPAGGNFCRAGTQSPLNISFPDQGKSTLWTCEGQDGGQPEVCEASRDAAPALPPPPEVEAPTTLITRDPTTVSVQGGRVTTVEGRLLETCVGLRYSEGVTIVTPPGRIESSGITIHQPKKP